MIFSLVMQAPVAGKRRRDDASSSGTPFVRLGRSKNAEFGLDEEVTFTKTAAPEAGGLRRSTRRRTEATPAIVVEETPSEELGSGLGDDDESISDPDFRAAAQRSDDDDDDDGGQS